MREKGVRSGVLVLVGALGLAACATMQPEPTLYERLRIVDVSGVPQLGRSAISLVVDDFAWDLDDPDDYSAPA